MSIFVNISNNMTKITDTVMVWYQDMVRGYNDGMQAALSYFNLPLGLLTFQIIALILFRKFKHRITDKTNAVWADRIEYGILLGMLGTTVWLLGLNFVKFKLTGGS